MSTPLLIRQRLRNDCGVASLAMLAGVAYEDAHAAFVAAGLGVLRPPRRAPFASNFKDLRKASNALGVNAVMLKFKSWAAIETRAIIKVLRRKNGNWHWVVAIRDSTGIVIYDPESDLQAFENPTLNTAMLDFTGYAPAGNILVLV